MAHHHGRALLMLLLLQLVKAAVTAARGAKCGDLGGEHLDLAAGGRCRGHDLALAEGVWVAHQDLLHGLEAPLVELLGVVAADAGAVRPAVPVIREALAVELEAARLATVARLAGGPVAASRPLFDRV